MKSIVIAIVCFVSTVVAFAQEEDAVKKAFEGYKSSILNDKGEAAVNHVDSRTINYYSSILEKTKTADSATVNGLGIMDKLMVLTIRHRTKKEDILKFDGKQLLVHAIKEGMVGKNSVSSLDIGTITINDDFAKAQVINNGQAAPLYFHFYKENAQWKIDLTSLFPASVAAFDAVIKESGQEENAFILNVLSMLSSKQPDGSIWKPLI